MRTNRRSWIAGLAGIGIGIAAGVVLVGCGGGSSTNLTPLTARVQLTPACSNPAPLSGTDYRQVPAYFVIFTEAAEGTSEQLTAPLVAKYGHTSIHIYKAVLKGFSGNLTAEQVAGLRCEPTVKYLEHATPGGIGNGS